MRNIVLIARTEINGFDLIRKEIIKKILDSEKYNIVLLIVNPATKIDYYQRLLGVEKVKTSLEIEYMESMKGLDYEIIKSQKKNQIHVENYLYRIYKDYQVDKFLYYAALSFWNNFFKTNKVDIVINTYTYHGWVWDVANLVAESYGIKNYFFESIGYNNVFIINDHGT